MSELSLNYKYTDFFSLGVLIFAAFLILLPLLVVFLPPWQLGVHLLEILPNKWYVANYRDPWERGNFFLGVC
jgi:multiple sugar transport system permease protein